MTGPRCEMRISQTMFDRLHAHLFPGDYDEHGATIEAGVVRSAGRVTLFARRLHLAKAGVDWLPGERGYRMMPASFIRKRIRACRDQNLAYLAVHNHGGRDRVQFSATDFETHERGFPALIDIAGGELPVGALVFAENAVAGDIWLPDLRRLQLSSLTVIGPQRKVLRPAPIPAANALYRFDRQVRLFGAEGQSLLAKSRVAIIGLGGVGSVLAEILGRLGVGHFVLVDPDRLHPTNLPRVIDASGWDAMTLLQGENCPRWMQRLGAKLAARKIDVARRVIRKANRGVRVQSFFKRMEEPDVVEALKGCDYIFLAADSHRARRLFNAIVYQYLIPGVQLGVRVQSDAETGEVVNVHTTVRLVTPESGCLICNQAISPQRLQEESTPTADLQRQRYTDEAAVVAPSVISLNAVTAAEAANGFLFFVTGLAAPDAFQGFVQTYPRARRTRFVAPRRDADCPDCSDAHESRSARGATIGLPLVD